MATVRVIVNFSKSARYAFNALVGALDSHISDPRLSICAARRRQDLPELLRENLSDFTVVLWSFYSPGFEAASCHLNEVKTLIDRDDIIHVAGGVHASAEPLQTLRAGFDYVVIGEGEQVLVELVQRLLAQQSLQDLQGLAYLENGNMQRRGRGPLIDLNDYPPFSPRYHMFGAIEITRGCVYACRFCQTPYVSKARFRHRSIENIVEYARRMRKEGFKDYRFITPTSLSYGAVGEEVNLDAIENLLSGVRLAVGHDARVFFGTFPSEIRPEHVSRDALELIKKYADNDNLIIGGQSGSQNVLDLSKRGHSVQAIVSAVELCVAEGFLPNVDFLFGLPGESERDVEATQALITTLIDKGAKIHCHTFMPLPGTPFQREAAGDVDEKSSQFIYRLESSGKAYGKWKKHAETAHRLVQLRDNRIE
ncbi:MAG: TIGR04013 family B12-binding domain/radical SAM domain-containing protein [Gammaproteobacteria bacterium]|nr:TIGR04013 family B12-binding domain/radical SAM domain-containing protein [Gammaproteobacteria bacterium]